jgi:hypothetical protein
LVRQHFPEEEVKIEVRSYPVDATKQVNPLRHRAIKVAFIFLKRPKMTKIVKIKIQGSNRAKSLRFIFEK